ncbi:MAG TPA: PQQ-dependent sugar dehydrogenase [Candidatus Limnocylindrales bacterium]|nr:PQQ-dependent sugar dehydrogenase [Candidatus Limnocylindrales bacterium]
MPGNASIQARLLVNGLSEPVDIQVAPGDTNRLFIVEKTGTIRVFRGGALEPRAFLDISSRVSNGSEQGLLGLAFHPQFASNRRFYVDYTDGSGNTHVVEFLASAGLDSATATEREILFVSQPASNHNGGQIAFGPDGYLYIALGDGGGGGDTYQNGQNLGSLLAKLLRVNVDAGSPYSIPSDNPFVSQAGARGETWDYGLRNPWRFCFDRLNGDLYIGDVGQDKYEEVDYEPHGAGGKNYGWNIMEGLHCYPPSTTTCNQSGLTLPVAEYPHPTGCSITGGYVYRGSEIPELNGTYFYGDYCTGIIRSFRIDQGNAVDARDWSAALRTQAGGAMQGLSSFGQDARGEIYLSLLSGEVYEIVRK